MEKNLFKDARYLRILSKVKGTAPPGPSSVSPLGYAHLKCEYPKCDNEFTGDFADAINNGWQHGYDASFCPKHNV